METPVLLILRIFLGGDVSQRNLRLAEGILDIFITYHAWVEKSVSLMQIAVYTYLRLLQVFIYVYKYFFCCTRSNNSVFAKFICVKTVVAQ